MIRAIALLLTLGLLLMDSRPAVAQVVTLSVTASPGAMNITSAPAAGSQPSAVTDASTSYRLTSLFAPQKKITAQLNAPMPTAMTLTATFATAGGGSSNGPVALDATARDMVINIGGALFSTSAITYVLSATVAAGVVPSQTRTVTLTILNYP
ncbi:MAG: hypothetical protein JWL61_1816 [Gemmatimonadetes bacterium]|nr:hypothetical protein [Gemmatimonadota bacterium]